MTVEVNDSRTASEELSGCRVDCDISALKSCIRGLDKSTSPRMLKANLEFLLDRYLWHPSSELPEHLRPNDKVSYHADNAGGAHGKDTNDK